MGETLRTTPQMPAHGFSLAVNFQNEKRTIDIGAGRDHKVARNFRSRRREVWVYKSRPRSGRRTAVGAKRRRVVWAVGSEGGRPRPPPVRWVQGCNIGENFEILYWKWCILVHFDWCNNSSQTTNFQACVGKSRRLNKLKFKVSLKWTCEGWISLSGRVRTSKSIFVTWPSMVLFYIFENPTD